MIHSLSQLCHYAKSPDPFPALKTRFGSIYFQSTNALAYFVPRHHHRQRFLKRCRNSLLGSNSFCRTSGRTLGRGLSPATSAARSSSSSRPRTSTTARTSAKSSRQSNSRQNWQWKIPIKFGSDEFRQVGYTYSRK